LHEALRPQGAPSEPLVLDGLRSFEGGQYWPFDLNVLVGPSHYVYGFNAAELRRGGTQTPAQRAKRARVEAAYGRPHRQATRRAVRELVGRVVPEGAKVEIRSDKHTQYPPALRSLRGREIRHRTTSSKERRTARNPLFPVNLADLLLRHTGANHKRETIAFSKRLQGALYRAAIFQVWRNYMKPRSERRRDAPPGVSMKLLAGKLEVEDVIRERRFVWRTRLSDWIRRCYFGQIPTRRLTRIRTHTLRYAV